MDLYNYVFRYTVKGLTPERDQAYTKKNEHPIPLERVIEEIRELYQGVDELYNAVITEVKIIKV